MNSIEVLPKTWSISALNYVARSVGGGTPSKTDASYWTEGTVPWVSPKDMKKFELRSSEDLVSIKALDRLSLIPEKSVLVVVRSGILSRTFPVSLNLVQVTINQDMRAFVPENGIDFRFLAWQLVAREREVLSSCSKHGTTVASIEGAALSNFPLAIAPTKEQHRIVAKIEELFSELDKGIENLKTTREQLKTYRQALLKYAFEGKLTAQWRVENRDKLESADALLKRIQQERAQRYQQQLAEWQTNGGSKPKAPKPLPALTAEELAELPELPEGWGWVKVADLALKITDGEHFRPPVQSKGIYFLSAKDVQNNGVVFDDPLFIDEETAAKARARCDPERNDILIVSRGATVGRMCIVHTDEVFCLLGSVILIKVLSSVSSDYVLFGLKSPLVNKRIVAASGATAQQAIYLRDIQHVPIPLCSLAEQVEISKLICEKLSVVDALEACLDIELLRSEALRRSILKKAFSGQLVPQDPHDEPASALLARIKAEKSAQSIGKKVRT